MPSRIAFRSILPAAIVLLVLLLGAGPASGAQAANLRPRRVALIGIGDSLTHGTMDATNNAIHTANAYLQKVAVALASETPLAFRQPFFNVAEKRLTPFLLPTNLGVDGADIFSLAGLLYGKRVGAPASLPSRDLLADRLLPRLLRDTYDKVLYPINLFAGAPTSQVDAAVWLLQDWAAVAHLERSLVVLWAGNNDSSLAALGGGGANPSFQPFPFAAVKDLLKPGLRLLLAFGEAQGAVSFAPFTQAAIERNLTESADFAAQYAAVVDRLQAAAAAAPVPVDLVLVTLPYYSAVGYLMDSEDLEYYLRKIDPGYTVPPTFKRVAPSGQPVTDFLPGDRVSLLTFGMLYAMLATGHSAAEVNAVLERDGMQADGLVLAEAEQQLIMARIDAFNSIIQAQAASRGPFVHLVDVGGVLNGALTGQTPVVVDGRQMSRKWVRGGAFSLDGVHPGYTGQAFIANLVVERLNAILGLAAPLHDLPAILAGDPYVDQDGDGWASGPAIAASGITSLLYLFKDPDDADPAVEPAIPADVWGRISDVLLAEILGIPAVREEASRRGLARPPAIAD
ncbi:MAG: hypothetical protein AB1634_07430 [Thermodesulfobacteriota bacterium]